MSYFDPIVSSSMRKEVLKDTPSENGDSLFKSGITSEDAFNHYDSNGKGKLTQEDFNNLLQDLFRDAKGNPHTVDSDKAKEMYSIFNKHDGITLDDFKECWNCWIKTILRPVSAIVIVDVQNDFINGSLAIKDYPAKEDGADCVPVINNALNSIPFDNIFYTKDWHPTNHISFFDNLNLPGREFSEDSPVKNKSDAKMFEEATFIGPPKTTVRFWPRHCVQGSEGAELHKDLIDHKLGQTILKGFDPLIDSFSGFFDNERLAKTELDAKLKEKGVTDVYTCGIATDVCVSYTSNDAQELGYRTILIKDAARGIFPDQIANTTTSIRSKHGLVLDSPEVKDIVQGLNRPVELGYAKALQCKN